MNPVPTGSLHARARTAATRDTQEAQRTEVNRTQQVPSSDFTRFRAKRDGDSFFRVLLMGTSNSPFSPVTNADVMNLRKATADYADENRSAFMMYSNESSMSASLSTLRTLGGWNRSSVDLAAPTAARVLGRELRVLEVAAQGGFYEAKDNQFFNPIRQTGSTASRETSSAPPIYLLKVNNGTQYEFLKPLSQQAGATLEWLNRPPTLEPNLNKLHEHFGIDDVDIISQEDWNNDDWCNSAFIRLSDNKKPFCLNMSLLKNSFEDTEFGNATGGNAEGHRSTLGDERYAKIPCANGTIYLMTNNDNEEAIDRLEQHVSSSNNDSAALLSFEFQHKARIASVSLNEFDEEYIQIGASMAHGQSEYPVYRLVGHEHKSIDQAKELARNGKELFDQSNAEQTLSPQDRDRASDRVDSSQTRSTRNMLERSTLGVPIRMDSSAGNRSTLQQLLEANETLETDDSTDEELSIMSQPESVSSSGVSEDDDGSVNSTSSSTSFEEREASSP